MQGCVIWLTGMSGAGKTTNARSLETRLRALGVKVEVLDGDIVRQHLSSDLGFSRHDRDENIRRIGFVCELLARNDIVVIVAAISPYREARDAVKRRVKRFIEVYMECPVELLVKYDAKGLYRKALAGEIKHFSGISDPYEQPLNPEVIVHSYRDTVEEGAEKIWNKLKELQLLS